MNELQLIFKKFTLPQKILFLIGSVSVLFIFIIVILIWLVFPPPDEGQLRVQYLEQYVNLIQIIAVGIVVTLLSIIIPMIIAEDKAKFERYKDSRLAYSKAKTAVLYLADRVQTVDKKTAFALIEEAHRELHLAETFQDIIISEKHLEWWEGNKKLWIPYNYWQIISVAKVLRIHDWGTSTESKNALKNNLEQIFETVDKYFGRTGDKCKGKEKKEVEKAVEIDIDKKIEGLDPNRH